MPEAIARVPLHVPDLALDPTPLTLCVWLVPVGRQVTIGERIVEIVAGPAVVDLPAPASGVLIEQSVPEDTVVETGTLLGWIERE